MQNIILSENVPYVIDTNTLKSHLRIEHSNEDEYLNMVIKMATGIIENLLSKSLVTKKYRFSYNPTRDYKQHKAKLPINNVTEIISVTQDNRDVDYLWQTKRNEIILYPISFENPILIEYKAGISTDVRHIPEELKFAVLYTAKNIYDCSEENILELKYIKDIVQRYRYLEL